jgi:MoxR-like ATPase
MIYNIKANEFSIKRTNFANFVLADEINRAPAKVQFCLKQCKKTSNYWWYYFQTRPTFLYWPPKPYRARRNLPASRSKVDRFMLKRLLIIQNGWRAFSHSSKSKRKLWESKSSGFSRTNLRAQEAVREVYMDEKIEKYILVILLPVTQRNIN